MKEFLVIDDFLYTMFPKPVAGSLSSSFRHWVKYKGITFLISYMKDVYRSAVLSQEWDSARGVKKILLRYLQQSSGTNASTRQRLFFSLLKTGSLFKASVTMKDYDVKIQELAKVGYYNHHLARELLSDPIPQFVERSEPAYSLGNSYFNKKVGNFSAETAADRYHHSLEISWLIVKYQSCFQDLFITKEGGFPEGFKYGNFEQPVGACRLLNKDGALKKRLIFIPHPMLQSALNPLYQALKRLALRDSSIVMFNKELGYDFMSESSPKPLWSIDLTSATDLFPLEWQIFYLKKLLPDYTEDIDLFGSVSRGMWTTPHKKQLRLAVGQPMGLRCSFLAFSLTFSQILHGVVPKSQYRILGDDLITTSPDVLPVLLDLGLPISEKKSFYSCQNGEFAGHTFYEGKVQRSSRIKDSSATLSMIEHRTWSVAYKALSRQFRRNFIKKLKFAASMPSPIGLGLNPKVLDQVSPEEVLNLYGREKRPILYLRKNSTSIFALTEAKKRVTGLFGSLLTGNSDRTRNLRSTLNLSRGYLKSDLQGFKSNSPFELLKGCRTWSEVKRKKAVLAYFYRDPLYLIECPNWTPAVESVILLRVLMRRIRHLKVFNPKLIEEVPMSDVQTINFQFNKDEEAYHHNGGEIHPAVLIFAKSVLPRTKTCWVHINFDNRSGVIHQYHVDLS